LFLELADFSSGIYFPRLQPSFLMQPLPGEFWFWIEGAPFAIGLGEEIRKFLCRKSVLLGVFRLNS